MLSKSLPALSAPELSGFSAASSGSSESAFVGVEVAAQNDNTVSDVRLAFSALSLSLEFFLEMRRIVKKQGCMVSTTATNSHN